MQARPTFTWHWQHLAFARRYLQRVIDGEIDRLMVFWPPRHGKSEQTTVSLPAWWLEYDPSVRFIIGAHTQRLADKFSRKIKRICKSRGVQISTEKNSADEWETTDEGGLRAAGVGTAVAGQGAEHILIDDPIRGVHDANSEVFRDKVHDWYTDDIYTRLEAEGSIMFSMTRWHPDDLAGRLLADHDGDQWTVINLPALAEANDMMGRKEGEALCPERFNVEQLLRIKRVMKDSFDGLYQQRPSPKGGKLVMREWVRRYTTRPEVGAQVVQSIDCPVKGKEQNSMYVCQTWYATKFGYYLVHEWAAHCTYPDAKRTIKNLAKRFKPGTMLIEDKGNGTAMIQEFRNGTRLPVIPVQPVVDKVTRFSAESGAYEAGLVHYPEYAAWLADHESEIFAFPNAATDDRADCVSQFLAWARRNALAFGFESLGTRDSLSSFYEEQQRVNELTGGLLTVGGNNFRYGTF